MLSLLLSPAGTIGRAGFAAGGMLLAVLTCAFDGCVALAEDESGLAGFAFVLFVAWSAGVLSRKRLHDLGWSGLTIAAFLGLYIVMILAVPFLPMWLPGWVSLRSFLFVALLSGPAVGWIVWLVITPGGLARSAQAAAARMAAGSQAGVHA